MKILRLLAVTFDTELPPWELSRFRGAMAHKVGLEHDWFHNHNNETGAVYQRYPLIQYKTNPGKDKTRPMLLCINHAIEEAHHFFSQSDWSLQIGNQVHTMRIGGLDVFQHNLSVSDQQHTYKLHHWQALNSEHYAEYRALEGIAERFAFLEKILAAHLLSFARGVDWQLTDRFEVRITDLLNDKWTTYKDVKVQTFSVAFKTNLLLPQWIGLGKGGSTGFGVLRNAS